MTRETVKQYITELLEYEERNDMFFLTTRERGEFQRAVNQAFDDREETIQEMLDIVEKVRTDKEYDSYYYAEEWSGIERACDEIRDAVMRLKEDTA